RQKRRPTNHRDMEITERRRTESMTDFYCYVDGWHGPCVTNARNRCFDCSCHRLAQTCFHTERRFPMETRKPESTETAEPCKKEQKTKLQIVKLEDRIAPKLAANHNETLVRDPAKANLL